VDTVAELDAVGVGDLVRAVDMFDAGLTCARAKQMKQRPAKQCFVARLRHARARVVDPVSTRDSLCTSSDPEPGSSR
jgi:hypothetical protein